jgi:hypothetical protein
MAFHIVSYLLGYRSVMKNASRSIFAVSLRVEIKNFARIVEFPSEFSEKRRWNHEPKPERAFAAFLRQRAQPYQWRKQEHLMLIQK